MTQFDVAPARDREINSLIRSSVEKSSVELFNNAPGLGESSTLNMQACHAG